MSQETCCSFRLSEASPLSDIYTLGATLHHVITRTDPRENPLFTFDRRPLKDHNPDVPDGLQDVIDSATMMNADDRYQSAAAMKAALAALV